MPVPDRRPSRNAAVWAGIAFGLAGTPFLLVGCVLVYLGSSGDRSPAVRGRVRPPAVAAFARTNRELRHRGTGLGTILGSATVAVGMCIPFVGVLILVPFLPAICAAVTATP
ncbi:hypothetical protein ACU686_30080 [Yinghuangia aomiensis]